MAHLNDRSRGDLLDPVRHHFKLSARWQGQSDGDWQGP